MELLFLELGYGEGELEDAEFVEDDGGALLAFHHFDGSFHVSQDLGLGEDAFLELHGVMDMEGELGILHIAIGQLEDGAKGLHLTVGDAGKVGEVVLGTGEGRVLDIALQERTLLQHIDAMGLVDTDEDLAMDDQTVVLVFLHGCIGFYGIGIVRIAVDETFGFVEKITAVNFLVALGQDDVPGGGVEDLANLGCLLLLMDDLVGRETPQTTIFSLFLLHGSAARPLSFVSGPDNYRLDTRVFFHTHIQAVSLMPFKTAKRSLDTWVGDDLRIQKEREPSPCPSVALGPEKTFSVNRQNNDAHAVGI